MKWKQKQPHRQNNSKVHSVLSEKKGKSIHTYTWLLILIPRYRICGVIVNVFASIAVDRRFELRSGQTKDYEIGICCFSAKHTAKTKAGWLEVGNNVSQRNDMSTRGPSFQWTSICLGLVQSERIIISLNVTCICLEHFSFGVIQQSLYHFIGADK